MLVNLSYSFIPLQKITTKRCRSRRSALKISKWRQRAKKVLWRMRKENDHLLHVDCDFFIFDFLKYSMGDKVLLVGGGGREHAIGWKLSQSNHVGQIFVAPGNAGISLQPKTQNIPSLDCNNNESIIKYCLENKIDFVIIGPEVPLANGLADALRDMKIPCFGPSRRAARIEASKQFAKEFMLRHGIPTSRWKAFTDPEEAFQHIELADYEALVIKASGLAAGKGVVVASSKEEAVKAVREMLQVIGNCPITLSLFMYKVLNSC